MASNNSADFRDLDIEVETSTGGRDHQWGFPYYLWRESADNRLYLGRPRYCCITPIEGELYFSYFDPTKDVKSTGASKAFLVTTGVFAAFMIVMSLWELATRDPLPYSMDRRPPPFFLLLGILFYPPVLGGMVAGPWYAFQTIKRWMNGRFAGDGRLVHLPFKQLGGFQVISARDAGAEVNGKPAQTGHGLTAVFEDGSQLILTGNAWNYASITGKHQDLTQAFRTPRDKILADWAEVLKAAKKLTEEQKKKQAPSDTPAGGDGAPDPAQPTKKGVPKKL